jgi:acyl-CoA synthetase (NDP forming)/RimJ/RimL family protein N-acetyltransferase
MAALKVSTRTGPAAREPARPGPGPAGASIFALLTDGSTAEIRAAGPQDADAVREMHAAMSPDNLYLRFFSMSPLSAEREARRVCREPSRGHAALLAWLGGRLVGVASYEPAGTAGRAEIAFAVPDDMHRHGVATLLLEHLVSLARLRGLTAFTASALADNSAMLRVFADAGLPVARQVAGGVAELTFPLPGAASTAGLERYLGSVAVRESRADVASLRYLLRPESVAVIGAGTEPAAAGRAVLHGIAAGGFAGRIYAVHPHARHLGGVPAVASVEDLPEPVDLAVLAVPASAVPAVAASCGRRGVRSLTVTAPDLGPAGADLLAICRRYGMRLVGPDSVGIEVPAIGLNSSFAATPPSPGVAGVVVQSGGAGIALMAHLSRLGIGVSSFASVGDKYDVSSNDMLTWWEQDELTRLAVLYVESFGSPRKFARTARRVAQRMPVLTVLGGSGARPGAAGPRAAAATPVAAPEALFGQAGVIAARSLGELIDAAALLACQPLPAGRRVAIVSNAGAAGAVTADACDDQGLQVAVLGAATRRRLRGLLPAGARAAGARAAEAVQTTAAVSADAFRAALEQVAADEGVDAVLAVAVPTAMSDLRSAIMAAAVSKPVAVVLLDQPESVRLLRRETVSAAEAGAVGSPAGGGPAAGGPAVDGLPAYARPEDALRALGHAARYRAWRDRQESDVPDLPGLRVGAARELIAGFLAGRPAGGWLPAGLAVKLLSCYGIRVAPGGHAAAASQPAGSATGGAEVSVRVVHEPVFGPLVVLGPGGTDTGAPAGHAARLTPLTPADADQLIRELRAEPLPSGLADLLVRVSCLADDLPEVAELDLHPVVAGPDRTCAADLRVRVTPAVAWDPLLRRLR